MDFSKLANYIDTLPALHVPAADIIVYRDHELVFRHMAGYRDMEKKVPVDGNETYNLFSCSKVMTTCAVMQLISAGKLGLDDAVSAYLPAFEELKVETEGGVTPAKTKLTIRHLMSMQGGLDYDLSAPAIVAENNRNSGMGSTLQLVNAMAQKPLHFEPGTDFMYSLCHDVLGAVIEVVSGMKFSEYLKANIWDKVGMMNTGFVFKEEMRATHAAQCFFEGFDKPLRVLAPDDIAYRLSPVYESGGAGLISCTEDYAKFADALACGGKTKSGEQILSPEMIRLWSTPQLCEKGQKTFDGWNRVGYGYALGVRTRIDDKHGRKGPVGEFGWDGAAGSYVFADPVNHISAFFAMHVRNFGYCYDVIHPTIQTLVYEGFGF